VFIVFLMPFVVARLRKDYEKYDKQEQEAAEELAEYQRRASEALERLQRVRKLKMETKDRGDEVFHRGIEALDAYDGINFQNEESAEATASGVPSFEQVDLGAIDLDLLLGLSNSGESFLPSTAHSRDAQ
jgi:hypothetical protein